MNGCPTVFKLHTAAIGGTRFRLGLWHKAGGGGRREVSLSFLLLVPFLQSQPLPPLQFALSKTDIEKKIPGKQILLLSCCGPDPNWELL